MRRGDTTTQMRRKSIISKLDRPGKTGEDTVACGAVGALCPTLTGSDWRWLWGGKGKILREGEEGRMWQVGLAWPCGERKCC